MEGRRLSPTANDSLGDATVLCNIENGKIIRTYFRFFFLARNLPLTEENVLRDGIMGDEPSKTMRHNFVNIQNWKKNMFKHIKKQQNKTDLLNRMKVWIV